MGKLIICGLPIGNISDLTKRALELLQNEEIFFAEDTRTFVTLLRALNIDSKSKTIDSFHDHSKTNKLAKVSSIIHSGKNVVLVSEAGSPLISDPAYPMINSLLDLGIEVDTVPGVTAPITALELSGLPPHPFHFHGFSPRDKGKRVSFLKSLMSQPGTHIIFESPVRCESFIDEMIDVFMGREVEIAICRELTKMYQTVHRFKNTDWSDVRGDVNFRGEFVVLFHIDKAQADVPSGSADITKLAKECLESKGKTKVLSKLLSSILKMDQKQVYKELS